jgi:hypothetical protein
MADDMNMKLKKIVLSTTVLLAALSQPNFFPDIWPSSAPVTAWWS